MHITIKFLIGVLQSWISIELCIGIYYSLKIAQQQKEIKSYPQAFIRKGRILLLIFMVCFSVCSLSIFILEDIQKDLEERKVYIEISYKTYVLSL